MDKTDTFVLAEATQTLHTASYQSREMQRNKDIYLYQIPNIQVVQRVRRQQTAAPKPLFKLSVTTEMQTINKRRKRNLKKPWEFLEINLRQYYRKGFSDRTKIHFTSCYYKNINLIQLKANIRSMTGVQMWCLKLNMQTEVQYLKSNESHVLRFDLNI